MMARDVAAAMNGRLVCGRPDTRIDTVSIDSRTVQAGDLFFAIHGERFDGHDFVAGAIGSGAAGVVVHRADSVAAARESVAAGTTGAATGAAGTEPVVIEVDDTTRALQALARDVRRQSGARVVAITGSAGKTTTKEVTAAFLALRYRTFRNKGNLNNHIGLPLSLLELRTRPEMAVVELGMSAPGEIRTLVAIAEPDVRVWTNVGEAHLESFPSVDAIADAKAEILESADRDACLVMNADDARVVERGRTFAGRVRSFGIDQPADVRATDVEDRGLDGMRATVRISTAFGDAESLRAGNGFAGGHAGAGHAGFDAAEKAEAESVTLEIPLLGRANLANVLAGMAVALDAGVPLPAIVERAATLSPASHRGEVKRLASGVTVLDDAYNANPLAVRRALDVIASEPHARRRVAVLGEMLELGPESVRLHEECGRAAVRSKIDVLVTVGKESARALGEAAVAAGLARDAVSHFADSTAAADAVAALVRPGDVVLVKGSRGVRLERVVERLHGAAS
jgi:UDP-N-acetylmuramoyl-tripeptide--D-alanyl-D-alanine ligase